MVDHCQQMALVYLRQKAKGGSLRPEYFGLTLEDLALDCCAELFERDSSGRFTVLRRYFENMRWPLMSEADVQIALRRLTFSKVNEELFRRYRASDPNLAKIVRNVKDAVGMIQGVQLVRRGQQRWIVVGDGELQHDRPVVAPEFLEAHLAAAVAPSMQVREAVNALVAFFRLRPDYRNGFPLIGFAKLIRSVFIRIGAADESLEQKHEHAFSQDEILEAIEKATRAVKQKMLPKYVKGGKVSASTFGLYLRTVRSIFESQYLHDGGQEHSYFDILALHAPGTSEAEYRSQHRNRIEYLVKLTRADMAGHLLAHPARRPGVQQAAA